jgi:hypothetical protein
MELSDDPAADRGLTLAGDRQPPGFEAPAPTIAPAGGDSREGDPMIQESYVSFVVQVERDDEYGHDWHTTSEPTENMFSVPVSDYQTKAEAEARMAALKVKYPDSTYRVAKRTVTIETD